LDIHFTGGIFYESAAPLAEKNAVALHYVLRSLISPQNEHRVSRSTVLEGITGRMKEWKQQK
jgi:hypothetical protein